jgi:hypothetical protein
MHEVTVMKELHHPQIVRLMGYSVGHITPACHSLHIINACTQDDEQLLIVMELMPLGELRQYLIANAPYLMRTRSAIIKDAWLASSLQTCCLGNACPIVGSWLRLWSIFRQKAMFIAMLLREMCWFLRRNSSRYERILCNVVCLYENRCCSWGTLACPHGLMGCRPCLTVLCLQSGWPLNH